MTDPQTTPPPPAPSGRRFSRWPAPSGDLRTLLLRVPPAKIGLVCSIIEAYEGVAIVRTTDCEAGLLELWIMPGQRETVEAVLAELTAQFSILRVRETEGHPDLTDAPMRKATHGSGTSDLR